MTDMIMGYQLLLSLICLGSNFDDFLECHSLSFARNGNRRFAIKLCLHSGKNSILKHQPTTHTTAHIPTPTNPTGRATHQPIQLHIDGQNPQPLLHLGPIPTVLTVPTSMPNSLFSSSSIISPLPLSTIIITITFILPVIISINALFC